MKKILTLATISLMSISFMAGCVEAESKYDKSISQNITESKNSVKSWWKKSKEKTKDFSDKNTPKDVVNKVKNKVDSVIDKAKSKVNNATTNNTNAEGDADLANLESNGRQFVEVNDNKATIDWNWSKNYINYSPLDSLNRAGKATAYLDKNNYGQSKGREAQTWKPTGWLNNQKRNKDRGHLIAYTLSFNFDQDGNFVKGKKGSIDNPKNLFTQTSQSNRGIMQDYETQVRDAIKSGKKVIYEATPIFRGSELMARGVHLQAISEDKTLNFNVYIFNIDDHYNFDYATGRSSKK